MSSRYSRYCSATRAIGMSVMSTSSIRIKCSSRSSGPSKIGQLDRVARVDRRPLALDGRAVARGSGVPSDGGRTRGGHVRSGHRLGGGGRRAEYRRSNEAGQPAPHTRNSDAPLANAYPAARMQHPRITEPLDFPERGSAAPNPSSPQAVAAAAASLLVIYVGLALAYRDAIPLFEAPDEPAHMHYAAFVHSHGRLPRQEPLEVPGEGMQPPLVYMVSAPLLGGSDLDVAWAAEELDRATVPTTRPARRTLGGGPSIASYQHGYRQWVTDGRLAPLQVLRFTSLAFGLLAVIFTFAAMWRLTHDARLALLAGSLLAFNPQFLFGSGYFSNDTAAASLGAAGLWLVVRALEEGRLAPPLRRRRGARGAGRTDQALDADRHRRRGRDDDRDRPPPVARAPRRHRVRGRDRAGARGPLGGMGAEAPRRIPRRNALVESASTMLRPENFGGIGPYLTSFYWDGPSSRTGRASAGSTSSCPSSCTSRSSRSRGPACWASSRAAPRSRRRRCARARCAAISSSDRAHARAAPRDEPRDREPAGATAVRDRAAGRLRLALGIHRLIGSERRLV